MILIFPILCHKKLETRPQSVTLKPNMKSYDNLAHWLTYIIVTHPLFRSHWDNTVPRKISKKYTTIVFNEYVKEKSMYVLIKSIGLSLLFIDHLRSFCYNLL